MKIDLPFYLFMIGLFSFSLNSTAQNTQALDARNDSTSVVNQNSQTDVIYVEVRFLENDIIPDKNNITTSIVRQTDQYGKGYLIENNTLLVFYPYEGSYGVDTVYYQICDKQNRCDQAKIIVNVIDPNQVEIFIPSSFSPNNDNINDKFYIEGIDKYPENELIIFSRWGTKVYEKKNYSNNEAWDGSYNKTGIKLGPGDKVPKGTYFFKLIIKEKEYVKSGYIVVKY